MGSRRPGVIVHACTSHTGEVKARDRKFQVNLGYHNKTLSKKKKKSNSCEVGIVFRDGGRSAVGVARAGSLNRGSNQISGEARSYRDGAFALHTACS